MLDKSNLHNYQRRAVDFICDKHNVALFLGLGLGKSIISLTAIDELMYDSFIVDKVLIIAPLRVINSVWEQEAKKWKHTQHLRFSNLSGGKANMLKGLQKTADVYLINRENIPALVEHLGKRWDFDMVIIDESSSFKNSRSKRFRAMKKIAHKIDYLTLLTGTPNPNGMIDLWSQFYLIDGGLRLGRTLTNYRSLYFDVDFFGYNYTLRHGALKKIQDKIQDVVLSMSAEDYLEVPEAIPIVMEQPLKGDLLKTYKKFEKEMLIKLNDEDTLTAVSAATLTNKLLQFCSGNVYDENGKVHHFHKLKIDMLKEVMEDYPNENLLIAYNYKHELEALTEAFPEAVVLDKKGKAIDEWNEGKIKMLLAQPQSASMGLNLQEGGNIVVWYGFTFNLESYLQFNARLHRQGQKNKVTILHLAVGKVEHKLMLALARKEKDLVGLLTNLKQ